jgi:hypothetical protein
LAVTFAVFSVSRPEKTLPLSLTTSSGVKDKSSPSALRRSTSMTSPSSTPTARLVS